MRYVGKTISSLARRLINHIYKAKSNRDKTAKSHWIREIGVGKMSRILIGLGYKAKSGKNTIADYLGKVHNFKQIGFADALKEGCRHIFGLSDEQLYGDKKEVIDAYWQLTPRYILQYVGTECMRDHFDKDIWIKAVEKKIVDNPDVNLVVTDIRFPNEAQAVRKWNGKLVRVDRPLAGAQGGIVSHPSEVAMEAFHDWDYVLKNDVNVHTSLYDKVEEMLTALDKPKP